MRGTGVLAWSELPQMTQTNKVSRDMPKRAPAKPKLHEVGSRLVEVRPKVRGLELKLADGCEDPSTMMRCPRCGQHFSSEGRYCPFDREPLVRAADWDPTGDPMLGLTIDRRYCVEAVIGEGGMGRVYRVQHISLGKRFALKALRKDLASDEEIAARFIHEARTAASVTHPGLVQILDFGQLPTGQAYFVMELLDGVPLSALLRRHGTISPMRAVKLAEKVAEALAAAHDAGVVHRDLKPDNIQVRVLDQHDEIKIVDFGLAKVVGGTRLTRDGIVFGTPYYMSPEQASGEATDHRADIYALGVLLYELLTGRVPFEADTYTGVLTKHIYLKPVPPSKLLGIPGQLECLEEIVLRCLEKDPARRFAKLTELVTALRAIPEETKRRWASLSPQPAPIEAGEQEFATTAFEVPSRRRLSLKTGGTLLIVSALLGAMVVASFVTRSPEQAWAPAKAGATEVLGTRDASPGPSSAASNTLAPTYRTLTAQGGATFGPSAGAKPAAPPIPRPPAPARSAQRPARSDGDIIDPWAK